MNVPEKGGLFQLKDTDFFVRVLSAGLTYTTYTPATQYGADNQTSSQLRTQMFNYLYEQKDKYFDWSSIVSQRSNIPTIRFAGNPTTINSNYFYYTHRAQEVAPAQQFIAETPFPVQAAVEEEEEEVDGLPEYDDEYVDEDDELVELDEPPYDLED